MFVEHDVCGIEVTVRRLRCVNEMVELDVSDEEERVKGLNDSEAKRTTAIADGFDGIDVTIPISEGPIIVGLLPCPLKRKCEDDDYGFINSCKPFIGVDGCHLKTKYEGQLLIVIGRNPNDQYLPLAFGVVETETKDSWRWFIQLLMEDVGKDNRYGLVALFEEMFERIEHRLCLRHLYANFKKKFGGGSLIRDLMMRTAKISYHQGWMQKMNKLKQIDQKARSWLMGVPPKCWCNNPFSFYLKCDLLMNNIIEYFNATILVARYKPILIMCEWIRKYLMNRCSTSAMKLEKWPHKVMSIPRKILDTEVTHSYNKQEFIVDIAKRSCTCNLWELVGISYRHVVAALGFRQQNPESFVDACYSREKYALWYGFVVSLINGQEMWPEVESEELLPPSFKKGPDRSRKLRIRESGEEGARIRLPSVSYRCTKCDKIGHNVKSCKSKKQNPNSLKRKVFCNDYCTLLVLFSND
ncbi:uncharacterized protein LOC131651056 [Vicia villosa]|uniref:uncharacterized protein LOC131651056 n=1 Tax=Vicia villosa TaxID=3911 RepID=UPI00273B2FBD|nr:uncharacterized protein LOC131651056 [Vicia villosa]